VTQLEEWLSEMKCSPHSEGRDGIHISAQLRIDAMQMNQHGIAWVSRTMETAASRIDELEKKLAETRSAQSRTKGE
jgi:hypothetical protein